jgi:hypothetical protein
MKEGNNCPMKKDIIKIIGQKEQICRICKILVDQQVQAFDGSEQLMGRFDNIDINLKALEHLHHELRFENEQVYFRGEYIGNVIFDDNYMNHYITTSEIIKIGETEFEFKKQIELDKFIETIFLDCEVQELLLEKILFELN